MQFCENIEANYIKTPWLANTQATEAVLLYSN